MPPRLRHVGVLTKPWSVRPYVQILNTSAWLIYQSDIDPQLSTAEFLAYVLAHGDRMAITGEVTRAALHNAAYWFERSDDECNAFATAAEASPRPDGDAFRALAAALPWLRQLSHESLRPPQLTAAYRAIPPTGLFVRRDLEARPAELVAQWVEVANRTVAQFRARQSAAGPREVARLCDWLTGTRPQLLLCGQRDRVLWDPATPARIGGLRSELKAATAAALHDIIDDLEVVHARTIAFHKAVLDSSALPAPTEMENRGYVYLHRNRGLIAYNLHEPGIERLQSPAIPYARAMLGARTIHEWCHLAVDAGWVPLQREGTAFTGLIESVARQLDAIINAAPAAIRLRNAADVRALLDADVELNGVVGRTRDLHPSPGLALVRIILRRLPDYRANLLAQRFLSPAERETYVRQNVRQLRSEYPPERLWRMLARYLYEYQYLAFSAVEERAEYFLRSTWFDADFLASGILDRTAFDTLTAAVAEICRSFAVEESKFRALGAD